MSKWDSVEVLAEVVEAGSFSAAADKLNVSKSHVSRQISQLENRLGVQLLIRTTRRLALTEVGRAYYERCREVLNNMNEADQSVMDLQDTPRGTLRMTVAGAFGERYIAPAAAAFSKLHPQLNVEINFTNLNVDLVAEGYDLAIRAGVLKDSSLIARRVAARKLYICANPEYLERYGRPDSITALKKHNCLIGSLATWRFREETGTHTDIRVDGKWKSNNGSSLLEAARAGLGLVQLPDFYVHEDLQSGRLESVMEQYQPSDTAVWAVYPSNRHLSPKVRLFVAYLVERFESIGYLSVAMATQYRNIPTNIITGFLGVGKTTLIRHLLKTKPTHERWAVLVNEFGEVGIDGALLAADNIAVKEVPGGCMCCSVGLPSKIALNQLIKAQNPDRILIEPTGLAHPKQVLAQFSGPEFEGVLDLQAVVCLVDPWCLSEPKFAELAAFADQIAMADVLLATKKLSSSEAQLQHFFEYASSLVPAKEKIDAIEQGNMPWQWLNEKHSKRLGGKTDRAQAHEHEVERKPLQLADEEEKEAPVQQWQRRENESEFAHSCGWRFPEGTLFKREVLLATLKTLAVPRIKGIFLTEEGWLSVNKMRDTVSCEAVLLAEESRVEMIALQSEHWLIIENQLKTCLG